MNYDELLKQYRDVPQQLKDMRQWVCFKLEPNQQKDKPPRKVPYIPQPGRPTRAAADDPSTWGTFEDAVTAQSSGYYTGIGFQFANNIFGIDLDHIVNKDGTITPKARYIVDTLNSYTEYSPSGTGIHIICVGSIPEGGNRSKDKVLEMYSKGRFFTVTGKVFEQPKNIQERTPEAAIIHEAFIKRHEEARIKKTVDAATPKESIAAPIELSEKELLNKAFAGKNGSNISKLYSGNWQDLYSSQSEADLALCNMLSWWVDYDAAKLDSLFRSSGLYRDKWDEKHGSMTYGERTISKALNGKTGEGYNPNRRKKTSPLHESIGNASSPMEDDLPASQLDDELAPELEEIEAKQNQESEEQPEDKEPERLPYARPLAPMSLYLCGDFQHDIAKFAEYQQRKSGYSNLDAAHDGLYPGMYVIGATSSLGKTTFSLQLCDQLAENGEHVIYFSLEQSKFELVAKSLSRYTAGIDIDSASTSKMIRSGYTNKTLDQAKSKYQLIADKINIIDGAFNVSIDVIRDTIEQSIIDFGRLPVVIIDYLQIVQPAEGKYFSADKNKIDDIVRVLKQIQTKYGLLMFIISSFNRANYMTPVDFESYKESGGIEYTADVLWGLQLNILHEDLFSQPNKIKEKREAIQQAKRQNPREIELVCLKNRYGGLYTASFRYDPYHDLFVPGEYTTMNSKREVNRL